MLNANIYSVRNLKGARKQIMLLIIRKKILAKILARYRREKRKKNRRQGL